ncbi:hypothetical protein [Scytonema sp. PCC 10023]|uniref:hypothetical protein n=1 Tax=Scytonema sp. PCC 10023 TaxID=1680591 RepID=UPI0039C6B32E
MGTFASFAKIFVGSYFGEGIVKSDVIVWFEWARRERIVLAMSGGDHSEQELHIGTK